MPNVQTSASPSSIGGKIVTGLILFVASVGILYWNDGRYDPSKEAKNAQRLEENSNQNGELIYEYGTITSDESIKDDYILPNNKYLALNREVEMYAWREELDDNDFPTYTKEWTTMPEDSSNFKNSSYTNPPMKVESKSILVENAKIGDYKVKLNKIKLPEFKDLELTQEIVNLPQGAQITKDGYIYIKYNNQLQITQSPQMYYQNPNSTISPTPTEFMSSTDNPQIGDIRIKYTYIENPLNDVTIIGKLNTRDKLIEPYFGKHNVKIYTIYRGSYDEAINTMHKSFTTSQWLWRAGGFFIMFFGIMSILSPITGLLEHVPIVGKMVNKGIALIAFVFSVVLSLIIIVLSSILHNPAIIVIIVGVIIGLTYKYIKLKQDENKGDLSTQEKLKNKKKTK